MSWIAFVHKWKKYVHVYFVHVPMFFRVNSNIIEGKPTTTITELVLAQIHDQETGNTTKHV